MKNIETKVLALLIFVALALILWWQFYPAKVLDVNDVKLLTPVVERGGVLQYQTSVCKYVDATATITTTFRDGLVYLRGISNSHVEKGCSDNTHAVEIPQNLPVGTYTYQLLLTYKLNPIRTESYTITTPSFDVR